MKTPTVKCLFLVLAIFYAGALPLILTNYNQGRAAVDTQVFHYPTIQHFTHTLDVHSYPCSMAPGYHILLARVARCCPDSMRTLKLAGSVFTALLFGLLVWMLTPRFGVLHTTAILLPAITSMYIFPAGVWLLPDNLAWVTVLAFLLLLLHPFSGISWYLCCGATLAIMVLVRQTNICFAGAFWLAAVWAGGITTSKASEFLRRLGSAFLASLPALAILAFLFQQWGGVRPPDTATFQSGHRFQPNFATPALFLALFCVYSLCCLPYLWNPVRQLVRSRRSLLIIWISLAAGLAISLLMPTDYNVDAGRMSGLWNLVRVTPVIAHHSILLSLLASAGAGMLTVCLLLVRGRRKWILAAACAGFVVAQTANNMAWERYHVGFIFLLLFLVVRELPQDEGIPQPRMCAVLPILFAVANTAFLVQGLR